MTLGQLLLLHLMAGGGVAVAVYLSTATRRPAERWFQVVTAVLFWPLYLPLLLSRGGEAREPLPDAAPADELARAIAQVDAELEAALHDLHGWADEALAREQERLRSLRSAWGSQAERVRAMDRLLDRPDPADLPTDSEWLRARQQLARRNRDRLRAVRDRTYQNLVETLAWVRELASMVHLAKFTGAPASRAEELVGQIAATADGLKVVTWQEEWDAALTTQEKRTA